MSYTTRKSLLRQVRDGDEIGWQKFYETYRPLILRRGMDFQLRAPELEELLSLVMADFFQKDLIGGKFDPDVVPEELKFRYEQKSGRFRSYLRSVVANHARKLLRKRRAGAVSLDAIGADLPAEELVDDDARWDAEWRSHLLKQALEELKNQVRPTTYQAFELYAINGRDVQEVANFLNLSIANVYTARSRCIARLKEIIANLDSLS